MNTKTEVFWRKNRKTEQKNSQNHRTENPNAPSLNTSEFENLSCHHNKQLLTDMKNSWFLLSCNPFLSIMLRDLVFTKK